MSKNLLVKKQSYIAELKEYSEKKYQSPPKTKLIGKAGKDNAPIFTMEIKVGDFIELGKGGSKKEALTDASKKILQRINIT
jgi:dsRNA-specific ribonuclease